MAHEKRFPHDKAAKLDDKGRRLRQPAGNLVELIAQLLAKAARAEPVIIDVGAGTGYFALPLAKALPAARIVALDVETKLLEKLMQRAREEGTAPRIQALQGEAEAPWQLDEGSAELVLMANVFHEFDDRRAVLAQAQRALAAGGLLLITDWNPQSPEEHGPPRRHRVSPEQARAELVAAGFEMASRQDIYSGHYTLVAQNRSM